MCLFLITSMRNGPAAPQVNWHFYLLDFCWLSAGGELLTCQHYCFAAQNLALEFGYFNRMLWTLQCYLWWDGRKITSVYFCTFYWSENGFSSGSVVTQLCVNILFPRLNKQWRGKHMISCEGLVSPQTMKNSVRGEYFSWGAPKLS